MENVFLQEPLGNLMPADDEASAFFEFPDFVDLAQSVPRAFEDPYPFVSGEGLPVICQHVPIPPPASAAIVWDDFQLPQPGFLPAIAPGREDKENDYQAQIVAYDSITSQDQQSSTPNYSIPSCPSTTTVTSPDSYSQPPVPQNVEKREERPRPGRRQQRSASSAVEHLRKRNRAAASTYRSRQRNNREYYAERSEALEQDSQKLQAEHHKLTAELAMLRQMLSQHTDCNCELIQRYLMSSAAAKWVDAGVVQRARNRYTLMAQLSGGPCDGYMQTYPLLCVPPASHGPHFPPHHS